MLLLWSNVEDVVVFVGLRIYFYIHCEINMDTKNLAAYNERLKDILEIKLGKHRVGLHLRSYATVYILSVENCIIIVLANLRSFHRTFNILT